MSSRNKDAIKLKNVYAAMPVVERGVPFNMSADPTNKTLVYTHGYTVVMRDLENPAVADLYTEHQYEVTAAKYAPSGYYVASGDASGTIRIWDTTQAEHPLKLEIRALSGRVNDICWSEDSKRIIAVGDGKETFGAAFLWDSGSSVGEITGHSKTLYSCDFKPNRPYRVATTGMDGNVNHFAGPPFRFQQSNKDHTNFVNQVRFSPNGELYCSVSSDKTALLFDGKTGEVVGQLNMDDNGHTGGIYGLSWSPDGKQILTASADKTCKLWDVETSGCVSTFTFGSEDLEFQQYGCLWAGDHMLSVQLDGSINYLDINNPQKPLRVLRGHNKTVQNMAYDSDNNRFYSASYDGIIREWVPEEGPTDTEFTGAGHTNTIVGMSLHSGSGTLVTAAMDDTVRVTNVEEKAYNTSFPVDVQPTAIAQGKGTPTLMVVTTLESILVMDSGDVTFELKTDYTPTSVDISPDETVVVVGAKDNLVRVFALSGGALELTGTIEDHRGELVQVAFSPDGTMFACCDTNREIRTYNTEDNSVKAKGWVFHAGRVNCIAWSPDNIHVASGGVDKNIFVWNVNKPTKRLVFKGAHMQGVESLVFLDDNTLLSAGSDTHMKTWSIEYP